MEHMEKGKVMDIRKGTTFPEEKAKKYFIDVLMGLEYSKC